MPKNMEKWRAAKRKWYLTVDRVRRKKWFEENGPCVDCGSWERLELDHEDPAQKVSNQVWSWSDAKRTAELAKCKPRCYWCHKKKTATDLRRMDVNAPRRREDPPGMAWCYVRQHFAPIEQFTKNKGKRRGLENECRECRREMRNKKPCE
jgi:hypothetical protein